MMRRSIGTNFARKLITLPQLSPSHTSSRLIERLVPSNVHVGEYTPLLIVSCSPDMIEDVAFRVSPYHRQLMLLEIIEDGRIKWLKNPKNDDHDDVRVVDDGDDGDDVNSMVDLPVGTVIGEVCDDDDDDDHNDDDVTEEWAWQAYMHDEDDDDGNGKKKEVELPPSLAWAAKRGLGSGSTSI